MCVSTMEVKSKCDGEMQRFLVRSWRNESGKLTYKVPSRRPWLQWWRWCWGGRWPPEPGFLSFTEKRAGPALETLRFAFRHHWTTVSVPMRITFLFEAKHRFNCGPSGLEFLRHFNQILLCKKSYDFTKKKVSFCISIRSALCSRSMWKRVCGG